MRKCIVSGCNKKHIAKNYCVKHYYRFKRHGNPNEAGRNKQYKSLEDTVKNTKD